MDRRRLRRRLGLTVAGLALAAVTAVVACSGASDASDDERGTALDDDGGSADDDASRGRRPAVGAGDGATAPGEGEDGEAPGPRPSDAAAAPDVFDAGVCPDPGSPSLAPALQGAPDYVATFGPSSRSASHGGNPNPSGRACLNCHNPGGTGRPFFFAGTVRPQPLGYVAKDAGPDAAPDAGDAGTIRVDAGVFPVQVLVREGQGRVLSVYTDQDGNFFLEASKAPPCAVYPVRGAIRRGTATKVMPNQQSTGNCLGCHGGATIALVAP